MIQHVYLRATETNASDIIVATDHEDIANAVTQFGGNVMMTKVDHPTGTDRLSQVIKAQSWSDDTIVVNLQGDEPHIPASLIQATAHALASNPQCDIATLATKMHSIEDILNPNRVKITLNNKSEALYFSRSAIPYDKKWNQTDGNLILDNKTPYYHHIGMYAYTVGFLKQFPNLTPCPIELAESLEQLRALCHGYRIFVHIIEQSPGHGVDTPEDLQRIEKLMSKPI
ncbi:3-deoxy-manno-octulosonate cytidylyltransferase [hydrothermal vent metagenome]|uniref:3-deoxy-manno-octulosonate cytidylyltransferase n=1 Tax=hydrothermal vent metagenome TaxID=652676 RepID=A0A3B1AKR8_9ZZZZ